MKIKHTEAVVITTIKWTESEKDTFMTGLEEIIYDEGSLYGLPEEIKSTMTTFFKEF